MTDQQRLQYMQEMRKFAGGDMKKAQCPACANQIDIPDDEKKGEPPWLDEEIVDWCGCRAGADW